MFFFARWRFLVKNQLYITATELCRFLKIRTDELRFFLLVCEMRNIVIGKKDFFRHYYLIPIPVPNPNKLWKTAKESDSTQLYTEREFCFVLICSVEERKETKKTKTYLGAALDISAELARLVIRLGAIVEK